MRRPLRIAAVAAATAVLISTAGASVAVIQHSVASASASTVVSADGPALLGGAQAEASLAAARVLGPIGTTKLPSIATVLKSAQAHTQGGATTSVPAGGTSSTPAARTSHERREHEGKGD